MADKTRSTVAAVIEEVTDGTIVVPSGATDFFPLLDGGFSMSPNFDVIENNEIRSSIGKSADIIGTEQPEAEYTLYLKHSGVEGQKPNWSEFLKSAFGAEEVNATQYDTVAGSTTTVINVDVGEGVNFSRGELLLGKDGTNGYFLRPVHSVSSDALTLAFPVGTAPGVGINLGKAIKYTSSDSNHPSLSIWQYDGNNADIQAMAGARVSELNMSVTAGEPIELSVSLSGTKYHFNPITITSSSKYIDFVTDNGTAAAVLTEKTYRSSYELAEEVQSKMDAAAGASETITCVYNSLGAKAGKFTIAASGTSVLTLKWATGANTANSAKTKLGFSNSDDSAALTYDSDSVQSYAAPYTPSFDNTNLLVAKYMEAFIGEGSNANDILCLGINGINFTLTNELQPVPDICAESGIDSYIYARREVSVEVSAYVKKHNVEQFKQYIKGTDIRFLFNFGSKTGGNWDAGKSGCLLVYGRIIEHNIVDSDGIVSVDMTIQGVVDSNSNPECYLNFV